MVNVYYARLTDSAEEGTPPDINQIFERQPKVSVLGMALQEIL